MNNTNPKVLIFIDWFAPGFKAGGPTTSNVNIVNRLRNKIDFYVVTSDTDYHAEKPYEEVESDKWTEREGVKVYYFSKAALTFSKMKAVAQEADCDIWYINGIYSKYFSIYPLLLAKRICPKKVIVSARGMLSPHALAIKPFAKKAYIHLAKLMGWFRNVEFHSTNEEEGDYIRNMIGKRTKVTAIENLPRKISVDFDFQKTKEKNEIRLVSFARVSSEKNTLFAIQALKGCKHQVVYDIYGQINSEAYWQICKKEIERLPENVMVRYKGSVSPNEMVDCYKKYHMLYLPSTGENFGHAILESLMNGCPVIISDNTPWRDLQNKQTGWDLSLNTQEVFAEAIDLCAEMSNEQYHEMSLSAYKFAREVIEDNSVKYKYEMLFRTN